MQRVISNGDNTIKKSINIFSKDFINLFSFSKLINLPLVYLIFLKC